MAARYRGFHRYDLTTCIACDQCAKACPVDCISLTVVNTERSGWAAWSGAQADEARTRSGFHQFRLQRDEQERIARLEARALGKLKVALEKLAGSERDVFVTQ